MREFEQYRQSKQKRLRVLRLEAVRTGFKKAWQERDYDTIITVARKIRESILQEGYQAPHVVRPQAVLRKGDDP